MLHSGKEKRSNFSGKRHFGITQNCLEGVDYNDRNCNFFFACSTVIDDNTTVIPEQTFTQFTNLTWL